MADQDRRRSREPPFDESAESTTYPEPTTTTGAKRLFSNRASRQLQLQTPDDEQAENVVLKVEDADDDTPSKRHRSSEWPLKNTEDPQSTPRNRPPLRHRNAPNSASSRRLSPPTRPSRFVEGSMNDRVSQKPPVPYLDGDDEFLEQYDAGISDPGRKPRPLSSIADRSESSNRHSIFRFGKSLAASFNPNNWKIWSKEKNKEEDEEVAQARALRERQEKAERIYRELKESGRFRDAAHVSQNSYQQAQPYSEQKPTTKHDSGVEFGDSDASARQSRESAKDGHDMSTTDSGDMSREEKRKGRIFLAPPNFPELNHRGQSPSSIVSGSVAPSDTSSPSKSSFMFKKGSLSNINSHFKKPSLSNIKKSFLGESRESLINISTSDFQQARRVPSRRDLQKQQKLVKRVSDLEGKLEAARRQLSEALGEPVPKIPAAGSERVTRPRFVPGALASLPSERLLSGYVDPDEDDLDDGEALSQFGMSVATVPAGRDFSVPRTTIPPEDHILQSVEAELDIKDSQEVIAKQLSHESLVASVTASTSEPTTKASDAKDSDYEDDGAAIEEEVSEQEMPKLHRTPKKRKSTSERLADDGGSYKPSPEPEESSGESEVKKATPRKVARTITLTGIARPSKLQKTSSSTLSGKSQQAQNQRASASRIRPRTGGLQAPARGRSNQSPAKVMSSPPPTRKISKVSSGLHKVKQSAQSPPSSPTFMGVKYEKPSPTSQAGSRANTPTGHINPYDVVYSADPNTEPDIPPMPPLPKSVRMPSGEVVKTTPAMISKPHALASPAKVAKSRPSPISPMKAKGDAKDPAENEDEPRLQSEGSYEWPDDVF